MDNRRLIPAHLFSFAYPVLGDLVGAHPVAEEEVAVDFGVVFLVDVDVVGSGRAFLEVAAEGDAVSWDIS